MGDIDVRRLIEFAETAFSAESLRRFLYLSEATRGVEMNIPGTEAPPGRVVFEAVRQLERENLLDLQLARGLAQTFPARVPEIVELFGLIIARRGYEDVQTLHPRRELMPHEALESLEATVGRRAGRAALTGPPWSGKSTVAWHFADSLSESCTVLWIEVGKQGMDAALVGHIADALGLTAVTKAQAWEIGNAFIRSLRSARTPTLLVLDDVREPDDAIQRIPEPDDQDLRVILTSRSDAARGVDGIAMSRPTAEAGCAFLAGHGRAEEDLAALVEQVGRAPAVLVQVRRILDGKLREPAELLEQVREGGYTGIAADPILWFHHEVSELLANDSEGRTGAVLNLLGTAHRDPVPVDLVREALNDHSPALDACLEQLVEAGILSVRRTTGGRTLLLHRYELVHDWLTRRPERWTPPQLANALGDHLRALHDTQALPTALAGWMQHLIPLAQEVDGGEDHPGWWTRLRTVQLLIEAGRAADARELLPPAPPRQWLDLFSFLRAQILNRLGKSNLNRSMSIYEDLARSDLSRDPHWGPELAYHWAKALQRDGKLTRAEEQFRNALDGRPGDQAHATMVMQSLGRVLSCLGRHAEALDLFEQALAPGAVNHPNHARALFGFGLALEQADRLRDAMSTLKEAAEAHDRSLGTAHPHSLATHVEYHRVAARLGEDGAVARARELLDELAATVGPDSDAVRRLETRLEDIPGPPPCQ